MKSSLPRFWWAEIGVTFAILSAVGAITLVALFGREWNGSILPLLTLPVQVLVSLISFGYLFAARRYTKRSLLAVSAVIVLSILASLAMFVPIHGGSYGHGP